MNKTPRKWPFYFMLGFMGDLIAILISFIVSAIFICIING